jgi:septal ring factor EnvC (AmiA/AmiB activator)
MPGLGWLLSPIGKTLVILVAFAAWTLYQRDQAADSARAECRAAHLQQTLNEIARQRDAARAALADAEKQQSVTDKEMADLENERDRLKVQKRPGTCSIPRADTKRLRNIR